MTTTIPLPTDPIKEVLAEAQRFLGVQEHPRDSNRGVEVDYFNREAGLDPAGAYPWCAAFVGQMGRQALGHLWPAPRTAGCQVLHDWAEKAAVLETEPQPGDCFLLWEEPLKRFGHTGFIVALGPPIVTIEGNTNPGGSRDGYGVFRRTRAFSSQDRYIRWVRLLTQSGG